MREAYFITSTINHWIPLFHRDDLAAIIVESFSYRVARGQITLHAYVIMPNHMHLIITLGEKTALRDFLRDFHKFTAKRIIEILRRENNTALTRLTSASRDRQIQIWQKTHSPKRLTSWEFFKQKVEYIHGIPV